MIELDSNELKKYYHTPVFSRNEMREVYAKHVEEIHSLKNGIKTLLSIMLPVEQAKEILPMIDKVKGNNDKKKIREVVKCT